MACRHSIVVQEEPRVGLGGGEVPSLGPARQVLVEHSLGWDVADAINGYHDVLGVVHGVQVVAPVGEPVGEDDHGGVRNEAHKVECPDPLRGGPAPAAAEKEPAIALLARDAVDGYAVLERAEERHGGEVVSGRGHGLARRHPVSPTATRRRGTTHPLRVGPPLFSIELTLRCVFLPVIPAYKLAVVSRVGSAEQLARGGSGRMVRIAKGIGGDQDDAFFTRGALLNMRLPPVHIEQLELI